MKGEKMDFLRDILGPEMKNETRNYDQVKCPECGWEDLESWEYSSEGEDGFEVVCGRCETTLYVRREITITYVSWNKTKYQQHKARESKYYGDYYPASMPEWLFS